MPVQPPTFNRRHRSVGASSIENAPPSGPLPRLYTLVSSPCSDLARWALQLSGYHYEERCYLPGCERHFGPVRSLRTASGRSERTSALPLLVTGGPEPQIIAHDAWQIAEMQLGAVSADVKLILRERVRPVVREIAAHFLTVQQRGEFYKIALLAPVPIWQKILYLSPYAVGVICGIKSRYASKDLSKAIETLRRATDELEQLMTERPMDFVLLKDDLPHANRLAVAAHYWPVLLYDGTGPTNFDEDFPVSIHDLTPDLKAVVRELRQRKVGQLVKETFARWT